jgi:N-acetylmuramoyl-L-alanine amidase
VSIEFRIQGIVARASGNFSLREVANLVIRRQYYPNNPELAEAIIYGNDKTTYNNLLVRIRQLNNLLPEAEYIPQIQAIIRIPTFDEFQEMIPSLDIEETGMATGIVEITIEENPPNTTIISAGHGMDRPGCIPGAIGPDGTPEVTWIFRLTSRLYPEMSRLGLSYINLKAAMEDGAIRGPYLDSRHHHRNKVYRSNELAARGNITLHFAIHADRNTSGFEGITFIVENSQRSDRNTRSRRIADFFRRKLDAAGVETRSMNDTATFPGRLAELRYTEAPSAYMEMGSMDTESSRRAMTNRMDTVARILAETIRDYNIERPDQ